MIDEVTLWYITQGVLGISNIILMAVVRYIYKEARTNEANWRVQEAKWRVDDKEKEKALRAEFSIEKNKMREDIRRVLDAKETAYKEERMEFLTQIRELFGKLEG